MKQTGADQPNRQDDGKQQGEGNQQRAANQGGHQGYRGHGGQHSGGMGGEHGGDLHDIGTGQSGMGGGAPGSGGHEADFRGEAREGQSRQSSGNPDDDLIPLRETEEVQQSAQREGMGRHRHSSRGNEQNLDGTIDIDDLGSHSRAAGKSD